MKLIHHVQKSFSENKEYKRLFGSIAQHPESPRKTVVQNLYGSAKALLTYQLFDDLRKNGRSLIAVTATTHEGESLYQDIKCFSSHPRVFYFPPWEILPYEGISPFYDIVHHRIEILHHLLSEEPLLIVTPIINLLKTIIPKDIFQQEYLNIELAKEIDYGNVVEKLVELGYSREHKVDQPGTFSMKGGIIDIFPSSSENPIRIELFDDEVESIRTFDCMTQLSIEQLESAEILPQRELIMTTESNVRAIDIIESRFPNLQDSKKVIDFLSQGIYFQGIEHLLPFFYNRSTFVDYIKSDSLFVFDEEVEIRKRADKIVKECNALFNQSHKANFVKANPEELYDQYDSIQHRLQDQIHLTHFTVSNQRDQVFQLAVSSSDSYVGDINLFKEKSQEKLEDGYRLCLFAAYEGQAHRLQSVLGAFNPKLDFDYKAIDSAKQKKETSNGFKKFDHGFYIGVAELSGGFALTEEKILLVLDREIFGRKRNIYKKLRKVTSNPIESFYDLKKDDLVVHLNYGIGLYKGMDRITAAGKEKDFILILYADDEKLYVPIEQMNLVQKYIGSDGKKANLDKLGSKSWERTKAKAKRSVELIAKELIQIYSARRKLQGYAFPSDTDWQHEFEAGFQYEETPDQLKAIEDIKADMQSPRPTDRLICGDVGYGKTEVAIRAAFKAVMAGKQVAILVPTTILCEQHFRTFKERFILYPIKVDMLSRLKSPKEQKEIMAKLKSGELDAVIGTHRIVSKDVQFKNLGLVIIDEEHRFGVKHKEALKAFRMLVDVISMTATPIPRTLHMSMVKIREMSVINTPPENRLPIETYVMEFSDDIIKDAIYRELDRNGQVYIIFNRIQTIKGFARFVNTLVPEARVCVAHGQMDEHDLENIVEAFIEQKYDIMISTTIIESGIDIPNANTMIIDRADTFGLSQLYQLRGRVGRGNRKGYCYLFYPPDRSLSEIAQKRLAVINEYTDLGSGFKIAMKDMEFRGAGNVLGIEQSGSIISVGFELYCKLLDEAVLELSENEIEKVGDLYVDLNYDGFIPESYIPDEKQRIEIYKKIAGAVSDEDIQGLNLELNDRFGKLPPIIDNLLVIAEIKVLAKNIRLVSVIEKGEEVMIEFNQHSKVRPERLIFLIQHHRNKIRVNPNESQLLYLKIGKTPLEEKVNFLKKILTDLR